MAQSTGKLFGFTREIHSILMEYQNYSEAVTYVLDKLMSGSNELENAIMRRFKKAKLGIQEPLEDLQSQVRSSASLLLTTVTDDTEHTPCTHSVGTAS